MRTLCIERKKKGKSKNVISTKVDIRDCQNNNESIGSYCSKLSTFLFLLKIGDLILEVLQAVHDVFDQVTRVHICGQESTCVSFVSRELELRELALDRVVFVPALTARAHSRAVARVTRRAYASLSSTRFEAIAIALAPLTTRTRFRRWACALSRHRFFLACTMFLVGLLFDVSGHGEAFYPCGFLFHRGLSASTVPIPAVATWIGHFVCVCWFWCGGGFGCRCDCWFWRTLTESGRHDRAGKLVAAYRVMDGVWTR